MQIIESTPFGVRSAVMRLEAEERSPAFLLFPMIHIAEEAFYDEVTRRLEACDVVLLEGVESRTSSLVTRWYGAVEKSSRLGLVTQHSMTLDHLGARKVRADVGGAEFDRRWWRIGNWIPYALALAGPLIGVYMRHLATREQIARHLTLNLRTSRDDILRSDDLREMDAVLLDWRDRRLIEVIEQERGDPDNTERTIAVVYGAKHMPAVIRHLTGDGGYRVAESEWVTVFDL